MKKCSSCGHVTENNSEFCPKCGQPMIKIKSCPKCGSDNTAESQFCLKCGASLTETVEAAGDLQLSNEKKNKKSNKKTLIAAISSVTAVVLIAGAAVGITALKKNRSNDSIAVSVPVPETETETVVFTATDIPEFQTTTTTTTAATTTKASTVTTTASTTTEKAKTDVDYLTYSDSEKCFYLYGVQYDYIYTTSYFVLYNYDDSYNNPIIYAYANGRDPNSIYSITYPDCSEEDPIALGYFCATRADTLLWDYAQITSLYSRCDNIILSNTSYTLTDSYSYFGHVFEDCYIVEDGRFYSEHAILDTFCSVLNISQIDVYNNYFCTENNGFYRGFVSWPDGNMYLKKCIGDSSILYYDNILKIDNYYYSDYDTIHYTCLKGNDYDCEYAGIDVIEFDLVYNYDTYSWTYSGNTLNLGDSGY